MDHRHLAVEFARQLRLLPYRRANPPIGSLETYELRRILGANARTIVEADLAVGVEIHVRAVGAVVELEITEQARCRKDVLEIHGLAPAGMADDDVGNETAAAEVLGGAGDRLAMKNRRFEGFHIAVGLLAGLACQFVFDLGDPGDVGFTRLGQKPHVPAVPRRQGRRQVLVLSGAILVDKQDIHGCLPAFPLPKYQAST